MPKESLPLKALIEGCKKNCRDAQEQLYRKYFPKMFGMCLRYVHNEDEAIDIVNSGFLKVFRKIDSFQHQGSFDSWVRRIVFNTLQDYLKRHSKYRENIYHTMPEHVSVKSQALSRLYAQDLYRLIDSLPPRMRTVFEMFAIEGYSHREISQKLNISEGTSKWMVSDARARIQKLLKKQGLL